MVYLLYGFGISNRSLAAYLERNGQDFYVWDDSNEVQSEIESLGYKLFGGLDSNFWGKIDVAVVTPGISRNKSNAIVAKCREMGIKITNDVALFLDMCTASKIGITGTFGKSTAVALVKHVYDYMLSNFSQATDLDQQRKELNTAKEKYFPYFTDQQKLNVENILNEMNVKDMEEYCNLNSHQIAGNFGIPCFDCDPKKHTIFELSAQQLDVCGSVDLGLGMIMNLKPQHLDEFESMDEYFKAKANILYKSKIKIVGDDVLEFAAAAGMLDLLADAKIMSTKSAFIEGSGENADLGDFATDDPDSSSACDSAERRPVDYALVDGVIFEKGEEVARIVTGSSNRYVFRFDSDYSSSIAETNVSLAPDSVIAAYAILRSTMPMLGPEKVVDMLDSFPGLPHRCEVIYGSGARDDKNGKQVCIINDSKSTNLLNTVYCIQNFPQFSKIALICGGKRVDQDLRILDSVADRIVFAGCIGSSASFLAEYFADKGIRCVIASLEDCFEMSLRVNPDAIIFSPGYASTDQYKNFEHRGNAFKEIVARCFE